MKLRYLAISTILAFSIISIGIFIFSESGEVSRFSQTAAIADFNSSLVVHYTFDEGSGTTAGDSKGSNTGNILGATWVDGKIGKALQFDGADSRIVTGSDVIGTGPVTVAAWIHPKSFGEGTLGGIVINNSFFFGVRSIGSTLYVTDNGSTYAFGASNSITLNTWQFVVVTRDASGVANLYVNGVASGDSNVNVGTPAAGISSVYIGNRSNLDRAFDGSIDDVRIYNKILSSSEIADLYTLGGGSVVVPPATPTPDPANPPANPPASDTIPPVISNGKPSGPQPISQAPTLSLTTNESATCKYDARSGISFDSMSSTFHTTGGTVHTSPLPAPSNNQKYFYYIKCKDASGNTNITDYVIGYSGMDSSNLQGLIPADRRIGWNEVGVPGGIPSRSTICADVTKAPYNTDKTGGTDAAPGIQKAINACPSGQVVYIPSGTYKIQTPLYFLPLSSGVNDGKAIRPLTVRGDGPGKTVLVPDIPQSPIVVGTEAPTAANAILGGYTKGSTSITVSNASNAKVGLLMDVSENDEPGLVVKASPGGNALRQVVYITGVNGNTISFTPSLYFTYKAELNPEYRLRPFVTSGIGFEDFSIVHVNTKSAFSMQLIQCYGCWVKNVESSKSPGYHILVVNSLCGEIRDSYLHDAISTGPNHAGIIFQPGGNGFLVENNTLMRLAPTIEINFASNGNVFAYNYSDESTNPAFIGVDLDTNHGAHNVMNLWEGNRGIMFQSDGYFGSVSHMTAFRNWFTGTHPTLTGNRQAVSLKRWSYYFNFVGNILGTPGYNNPGKSGMYEIEIPGYDYSQPVIYQLGYPNPGNNWFSKTNPPISPTSGGPSASQELDLNVKATLYRHGNFDYVTNSTIWDPNISNHTIPSSLYLSGKPSWFGSVPFPPIGPDVSGYTNRIPAQVCYEQGKMPNCLGGSGSSPIIVSDPTIINEPPQAPVQPSSAPTSTPVILPIIQPPVTPPSVVPPSVTIFPPITLPPSIPPTVPTPNLISRILPSFTSTTRTPTTPSTVTKPKTLGGPFVPLPEATPEDIASSTERTSFTATIKDILSYILTRISNGFKRVFRSTSLISLQGQTAAVADFDSALLGHYTFADAATDFIDPHSTVIPAYPASACAWVTPELKGDGLFQYIVDSGSFHLSIFQSGTRLALRFYNDSNAIATSYGAISTGVKQHVCVTVGTDRTTQLYINSASVAGPTILNPVSYFGPTHIGYDGSGGYVNGYLEDVRIYNRVLSANEIHDLYVAVPVGNTTTSDTTPPPVLPPVTPTPDPVVTPPPVPETPPQPIIETYHAPTGQLIPSERLVDWSVGSSVGVPGGIDQFLPGGSRARTHLIDVTQSPYNADTTGLTDASKAINTAIANSKSGDVIYLPSGTYKLGSEITTAIGLDYRDNITIRGAGDCSTGTGCTILKPTGKALTVGAGDGYNFFKFAALIPSADLKKGQTVIPFADTSKINVGDLFHLSLSDNIDPNHLVISRNGKGRSRSQKFRVMAKTSNSITVFPPLHYDMPLSLSPRAANVPWVAEFVGVEDLKIDLINSTDGLPVSMKQAYGSWFKNVTITDAQDFHLRVYASIGCEIRGSQLLRRKSSSGPGGSGLIIEESQNCLIEDNIITKTASHIQMNYGDSGNVIAYNFLYDSRLAGVWGPSLKPNHGPYNSMNLFEGNVAADLQDDGYHGGGGSNTVFRNWFYGTMPRVGNEHIFEAGRYILNLCRFARDYSVIGNVLGMQGVVNGSYALGWPNTGNSGWKGEVQPSKGIWWADWPAWLAGTYNKDDTGFQELDLDVAATTLLKNNYLVGQGIPSTEVLGSGESVPASLFRPSKPSYFGNLAWPPIGPETISSWSPTQGSLTSRAIIPAQARYYGLSVPGIVTPPPVIVSQNTPQTPPTPNVSTTTPLNIPTQLPVVPAQLPITPSIPTIPQGTPAVPSIISRILPSFTSPTRTPTTPSNVTKTKTPSGPFVPLPEVEDEEIGITVKQSFSATVKELFAYIVGRIWNGIQRVVGR